MPALPPPDHSGRDWLIAIVIALAIFFGIAAIFGWLS